MVKNGFLIFNNRKDEMFVIILTDTVLGSTYFQEMTSRDSRLVIGSKLAHR